jgi:hypothetical protein
MMMGFLFKAGGLRRALARLLPARCAGLLGTVTLARGAIWSHRAHSRGLTLTCHESETHGHGAMAHARGLAAR